MTIDYSNANLLATYGLFAHYDYIGDENERAHYLAEYIQILAERKRRNIKNPMQDDDLFHDCMEAADLAISLAK